MTKAISISEPRPSTPRFRRPRPGLSGVADLIDSVVAGTAPVSVAANVADMSRNGPPHAAAVDVRVVLDR